MGSSHLGEAVMREGTGEGDNSERGEMQKGASRILFLERTE